MKLCSSLFGTLKTHSSEGTLMEGTLPVSLLSVAAALLPVVTLLFLLAGRGWSTSSAAPVALVFAVLAAVFVFRTPMQTLAVASGKGIWDAIFILYVVWPALILYRVANGAKAFDAIRAGVLKVIPDRLLVVLVFAWVLTPFIQSIAGFGAPLAIVAPILLGLGVRPVYAVLLPIIGGAWANAFGSLGAPWLTLTSVVEVPDVEATLRAAALLAWIADLTAGLAIAWMYGRSWALRRGLPAILVISALHGGLLYVLLPVLPPLATLIACAAALVAALLLARWGLYRQEDGENEPDRIFESWADASADPLQMEGGSGEALKMPLRVAFAPYVLLAVVAVGVLAVNPVRTGYSAIADEWVPIRPGTDGLFVMALFPGTGTGFGVVSPAQDAYSAFAPLTHPGTFLLLAALVGYFVFRRRGLYPEGAGIAAIVRQAAGDALPVTTSVTALLLMSAVMSHSGEMTVLGLALSAVAGSTVYLALANVVGLLGAMATSSSTSSNALFGPLQATAAGAEGVSVNVVVAAQLAGSAVGNAISPADALMGATTVGRPDAVGEILRRAIPWALGTAALIAVATVLLAQTGGAGS